MRSRILTISFILVMIVFNGNQQVNAEETNKIQENKTSREQAWRIQRDARRCGKGSQAPAKKIIDIYPL